jgi:hypothetical protein
MNRKKFFLRGVVILSLTVFLLGAAGCGYFKNVRDDFMDIGTLGAGVVVPVMKTEEGQKAFAPIPHAIGVYVQCTDFFHLGYLTKQTYDLDWDRRGLAVNEDIRTMGGYTFDHSIRLYQNPVAANKYKREGNELDGWRTHMENLKMPFSDTGAKRLIYNKKSEKQPFFYKGWQDWETFSVELAVPEPFILHSGIYLKAGVDPSQVFDAVLSLFCIDLYQDAAYRLDGSLRY